MNYKHLAYLASCCAISSAFYACGDDITEMVEGGMKTVSSIKDVECSAENDGESVFAEDEHALYVCSDEKWYPVSGSEAVIQRCSAEALKDSTGYKIICDKEVIATVTNGKAGEKVDESKLSASISKDVEAKLNDALSKELDEKLKDVPTCKVGESVVDEKTSTMSVEIVCGEEKATIELPVLTPSKNLSKVYKKTVVVRYPTSYVEGKNFSYQMTTPLRLAENSAELVVMEVDSDFNQTGKNFVSDLVKEATESNTFIYDEIWSGGYSEHLYRMQGDFSVTNMLSSYAQIRVVLKEAFWIESQQYEPFVGDADRMVYNALVNLDESDTIVLDFLTDIKAARVKNLIDGGKTFEAASKQANSEVALAVGLDEEAAPFEHKMLTKMDMKEYTAAIAYPFILRSWESFGLYDNYAGAYAGYKKIFAENGNFNEPLKLTTNEYWNGNGVIHEGSYDLFLVDFPALTFEYSEYKFVQRGLNAAYNLPACNESQSRLYESKVDGGFFKAFWCDQEEESWKPVSDVYEEIDDIATVILGKACDAEVIQNNRFANFEFAGYRIQVACSYNQRSNEYYWSTEFEGYTITDCDGLETGDVFKAKYDGGDTWYRCIETPNGLYPEMIEYPELELKTACNANTKDTLYTIEGDDYFYGCTKFYDGYSYGRIYGADTVATKQVGACDASKEGQIENVYLQPSYKGDVKCEGGKWRIMYANDFIEKSLGVCNEEKMKEAKLYKVDVGELEQGSALSYMGYVKCDYEYQYRCEENRCFDEEIGMQWSTEVSFEEGKLQKACTESNLGDEITLDGSDYVCLKNESCNFYNNKDHCRQFISWFNIQEYCNNQIDDEYSRLYVICYTGKSAYGYVDDKWIPFISTDKYCTEQVGECTEEQTESCNYPFFGGIESTCESMGEEVEVEGSCDDYGNGCVYTTIQRYYWYEPH